MNIQAMMKQAQNLRLESINQSTFIISRDNSGPLSVLPVRHDRNIPACTFGAPDQERGLGEGRVKGGSQGRLDYIF